MLGMISTFIHTTEDHIEKRIIRVVSSIALGALLLLLASGWVSVALYLQLTKWLLPWQAALAMGVGALILGAIILALGLMKNRRKQSHDDLIDTLVGALTQSPEQSFGALETGRKRSTPEAALIAALIGSILYGKTSR